MADEVLQRRILKLLGRLAIKQVKPQIKSYKGKPIRVLQRALHAKLINDRELHLIVPHFWAVYVHEGRRAPFGAKNGTFLIWYKNPRNDPRLQGSGGYTPQRASAIRHLSPEQFQDAIEAHRDAIRNGTPSPVVITRSVRKSTPPSPFFRNTPGGGMFRFIDKANEEGGKEAKNYLLTKLKKQLGVKSRIPLVPAGLSIDIRPIEDEAKSGL